MLENIWREHHDQLLSFIRKRIKDDDLAEDILQDVFVKILLKIDTLKDQSKLKSWIYQLTRNAIYDHYRSSRASEDIEKINSDADTDSLSQAMQEATGWIGYYVHALPETYREALVLYELEGMSQKEIAEKLNLSYVNTRTRIQRGRQILKKNLTDCCVFNVNTYGNIIDYSRKQKNCKNCNS